MSQTDTQQTTAQTIDHSDRFTRGDKLVAPNERVYTVGDVYQDADGGTRVKLRHATQRKMYRSTSRVATICDDGEWTHVVGDGSKFEPSPSNSSQKNYEDGA